MSRPRRVAVVMLGGLCGVTAGCTMAGSPAPPAGAASDPEANPAAHAASDPTPGPALRPAAVQDSSCPATVGQRLLDAMNQQRGRRGLPSLRPHPELIAAARAHADDQAARGTVTHVGSDGSAGSERVSRAGYAWATTGENVAGGYDDPTKVVAAWLDSPPHRAILLEPEAVHAGVGFTQASQDGFRWFWALTVAAPGELEDTPAVRCHP